MICNPFFLRQRRWTGNRGTGSSAPVPAEWPSEGLCRGCFGPFVNEKAASTLGSRGSDVVIYKGFVFVLFSMLAFVIDD